MRVLVTNDDGIEAPGLAVLASMAVDYGLDVVIAAPARQSSGSSASITAAEEDGRIAIERRSLPGLAGVDTFAVRGAPALIALVAAHGAFGPPPTLVLSGINHGANVGRAILHSGTVGAALTGGLNAARGLAISLDVGMAPTEFHWKAAAEVSTRVLPHLLEQPLGTVFNLNVPNAETAPDIREAALAPFGIVQTTMTEHSDTYVRMAVEDLPNTPHPGSDAALLAQGYATITSITPISQQPSQWPEGDAS